MQRVGVIDLGSNSLKLLVTEGPELRTLQRATAEVRLFPPRGNRLDPAAIDAAIGALGDLAERARQAGVSRLAIIGTSALREADNRATLAQALEARLGLRLAVISGETEARLTADGMRRDPALAGLPAFVGFDLGGGSLEVARVLHGRCTFAASFPLGAVRLTRTFLGDGVSAIRPGDLEALREHALGQLAPRVPHLSARGMPLVGAGGALATLLDIQRASGEPGDRIGILTVRNWLSRLAERDLEGRRAIPGVPAARADIMPAALAVVCALADHVGAEVLQVSHYGLRQGMAALLMTDAGDLLSSAVPLR
jgi:exopolyphosphatase / guanosine-5'-triphosphate,3'-diphosphate pyrophosphatase